MKLLRTLALTGSLVCAGAAGAQAPHVVRIGGAAGIGNAHGPLDSEFKKDGIKDEWIFFSGAGPTVNKALPAQQVDGVFLGHLAAWVAPQFVDAAPKGPTLEKAWPRLDRNGRALP